ncbi:hypothetical protein Tco_0758515 [Tanacetum coccineum]
MLIMIFFIHSFWIACLLPDFFRHCSNLSLRLVGRLLGIRPLSREFVELAMAILYIVRRCLPFDVMCESREKDTEKRAESPDDVLLEITLAFCTFGRCSFEPSLSDSFKFGNDEMTELVMDSGGSYHMTHKMDFLYDFKGFDGGSVQLGDNRICTIKGTGKVKIQLHDGSSFIMEYVRYVPRLRRSLISLGTLEKEGYTVKMQMGRIKVIKGCRVMMTGNMSAKVMTFGVQKHEDSKQVGFKKLGVKQGAQGNREAEIFQASNDDAAVTQRRLEDKQLEEKTNTDYLIKEQENVHLSIKVGVNIMLTRVPGQEGVEGNVAKKKKVKESMEANLKKLLK